MCIRNRFVLNRESKIGNWESEIGNRELEIGNGKSCRILALYSIHLSEVFAMTDRKPVNQASRRKFLKGAAVAAPGMAAANALGVFRQTSAPVPRKWDKEADVVILGGGNNAEALGTGQIAGRNAAAAKPWQGSLELDCRRKHER